MVEWGNLPENTSTREQRLEAPMKVWGRALAGYYSYVLGCL
jgi:hypothetical protein